MSISRIAAAVGLVALLGTTPTPVAGAPIICGDCDLNSTGPDILDSLRAAQIAAGLIMPAPSQGTVCDVDSSGDINVLDALFMAQAAAGLPVTLMCTP